MRRSNSKSTADSARAREAQSESKGAGKGGKPGTIARLQRAVGNQVFGEHLAQADGETGVHVSEPGDPTEREAARVADRVRRETAVAANGDQPTSISVQRSVRGDAGSPMPDTGRSVRESLGGGEPLHAETRSFFERAFGTDFSSVRVHTGPGPNAVARTLDAAAVTVGEDVVFARDRYRPAEPSGLLAHELTHVVQQRAGATTMQRQAEATSEAESGHARYESGERERWASRGLGFESAMDTEPVPGTLPAMRLVEQAVGSRIVGGRTRAGSQGVVRPRAYRSDLIWNLPVDETTQAGSAFAPSRVADAGGERFEDYVHGLLFEGQQDLFVSLGQTGNPGTEWVRVFYTVGFSDHVGGEGVENQVLRDVRAEVAGAEIQRQVQGKVGIGEKANRSHRHWGLVGSSGGTGVGPMQYPSNHTELAGANPEQLARAFNRSVAVFDMVFEAQKYEWDLLDRTEAQLESQANAGDEEARLHLAILAAWKDDSVDFTYWEPGDVDAIADDPTTPPFQLIRDHTADGRAYLDEYLELSTSVDDMVGRLDRLESRIDAGMRRWNWLRAYRYAGGGMPERMEWLEHEINDRTDDPGTIYGRRDDAL
ncbi:MAG: DUF4157 domain-containing protein [Haloarculaceae archaeon]